MSELLKQLKRPCRYTEEDKKEIFQEYLKGEKSMSKLGKEYGCSQQNISAIVKKYSKIYSS